MKRNGGGVEGRALDEVGAGVPRGGSFLGTCAGWAVGNRRHGGGMRPGRSRHWLGSGLGSWEPPPRLLDGEVLAAFGGEAWVGGGDLAVGEEAVSI